jgi:hypothetical protein
MLALSSSARPWFRLPHAGKHLLFALLGLADLTFTWALLQQGRGQVYEANPVAAWCLRHHGWVGLGVFKAVMLLSGSGVSAAISLRRPGTAGRVLAVGCVATASVVVYSGYLATACAAPLEELRGAQDQQERIEARQVQVREVAVLLQRLAESLAGDHQSLAEAVAELEPAARANGDWVGALRLTYPDRSASQCLALCLMRRCLDSGLDEDQHNALAVRLSAAFRSLFGEPPPEEVVPGGVRLDACGRLATANRF